MIIRIGFFSDTYLPQINGVSYTIKNWKEELERRGHEIYLFYPGAPCHAIPQSKIESDSHNKIRYRPIRYYRGYRLALPHFPSYEERYTDKIDIVHTHTPFTVAMLGYYLSTKLKIPRIDTFHTPMEFYINYLGINPLKPLLKAFYHRWMRFNMNNADFRTAPTRVIKKMLEKNGIRNVEVLSNGVDVDFFKYTKPHYFKEKYGIDSEEVIGFCGRLGYEKNLEDLITVADNFECVLVVGEGPAREHYRRIAPENVIFLKFLPREEIPAFYSALDVFAFPSVVETQGLVALEANACGTPVVGARSLALVETIEEGVNGLLYEANNSEELLEKIEKAKKLSKAGCRKIAEKNSVKRTVDRLEKIYSYMEYSQSIRKNVYASFKALNTVFKVV